jgi:hypothetical protein
MIRLFDGISSSLALGLIDSCCLRRGNDPAATSGAAWPYRAFALASDMLHDLSAQGGSTALSRRFRRYAGKITAAQRKLPLLVDSHS